VHVLPCQPATRVRHGIALVSGHAGSGQPSSFWHESEHCVVPSALRPTVVHGEHVSTKPHQRMLLSASLMQRPTVGVQKRPGDGTDVLVQMSA
jgi:hypothetical protein